MTDNAQKTRKLRVAGLDTQKPTPFKLEPSAPQRKAIAAQLKLIELRKVRFEGRIAPTGDADWTLTGDLGATVVQPCVLTLEPVSTRIDVPVSRLFLAKWETAPVSDEEVEINPDDNSEPLNTHIDMDAILIEALSLALPLYPKAEGASLETTSFSKAGVTPMTDEAARPFAGLASLRDKLKKDE